MGSSRAYGALTGRMRVVYKDGRVEETRYGLTSMCRVLLDDGVESYELEGRDY